MSTQSPLSKEEMKLKTGMRIKEFRTSVIKKTQTQVAKDLDMTQKSISDYEQGKVYPSTAFFEKFSARYGSNSRWLQSGIGPRSVTEKEINKSNPDEKIRLIEGKLERLENQLSFLENQLEKIISILEHVPSKA